MSGPDTVVQVDTGEEVVQVVVVHTSSPRELHTQVLQSTVDTVPGVQEVEGVVVEVVVVVVAVVVVVEQAAQHRLAISSRAAVRCLASFHTINTDRS